MKTTLNIQDDLLVRAKALAAQERTSLTKIIEQGLRLRLRPIIPSPRTLPRLPVSKCQGGFLPGIDPTSNRSMFDAADRDA